MAYVSTKYCKGLPCGTKSWTSFSQIFQWYLWHFSTIFFDWPIFSNGVCALNKCVLRVTIHFYQQSIYLEEEETKKSRDESVTAPAVWEFSICSSLAWMVLSWWVPCTWPARLWAQWDGSRKPSSGGWPRTRPSAWASSKRQPCNDQPERWTTLKQMIQRGECLHFY